MRLPLHLKMPLDADAALSSSSVGNWLGQELELRGIDSVVYTRYILSILLQDDFHLDLRDPDFFPPSKKAAKHTEEHRSSKCRIRRFDLKSKLNEADSEMMKKSAAVECLKSVTDEVAGIESLVDELYTKLQEQQAAQLDVSDAAVNCTHATPAVNDPYESSDSVISSSSEDPAERYYAAFPALSEKTAEFCLSVLCTPGEWAKMAKKPSPNQSLSEPEDAPFSPDKDEQKEAKKRSSCDCRSPHSVCPKKRIPSDLHKRQRRSHPKHPHHKRYCRQELFWPVPAHSVDQIKGKCIFQDVEPDTAHNHCSQHRVKTYRTSFFQWSALEIPPEKSREKKVVCPVPDDQDEEKGEEKESEMEQTADVEQGGVYEWFSTVDDVKEEDGPNLLACLADDPKMNSPPLGSPSLPPLLPPEWSRAPCKPEITRPDSCLEEDTSFFFDEGTTQMLLVDEVIFQRLVQAHPQRYNVEPSDKGHRLLISISKSDLKDEGHHYAYRHPAEEFDDVVADILRGVLFNDQQELENDRAVSTDGHSDVLDHMGEELCSKLNAVEVEREANRHLSLGNGAVRSVVVDNPLSPPGACRPMFEMGGEPIEITSDDEDLMDAMQLPCTYTEERASMNRGSSSSLASFSPPQIPFTVHLGGSPPRAVWPSDVHIDGMPPSCWSCNIPRRVSNGSVRARAAASGRAKVSASGRANVSASDRANVSASDRANASASGSDNISAGTFASVGTGDNANFNDFSVLWKLGSLLPPPPPPHPDGANAPSESLTSQQLGILQSLGDHMHRSDLRARLQQYWETNPSDEPLPQSVWPNRLYDQQLLSLSPDSTESSLVNESPADYSLFRDDPVLPPLSAIHQSSFRSSENSAFSRRRLPSQPLSYAYSMLPFIAAALGPVGSFNPHRLARVEHIYGADGSALLSHLGLDSQPRSVPISPNHHFRPIQTSTEVPGTPTPTPTPPPSPPPVAIGLPSPRRPNSVPVDEIESDVGPIESLDPYVGRCESLFGLRYAGYQSYKGFESSTFSSFIPSFRLQPEELGRGLQTGDEQSQEEALTKRVLQCAVSVLEPDVPPSGEQPSLEEISLHESLHESLLELSDGLQETLPDMDAENQQLVISAMANIWANFDGDLGGDRWPLQPDSAQPGAELVPVFGLDPALAEVWGEPAAIADRTEEPLAKAQHWGGVVSPSHEMRPSGHDMQPSGHEIQPAVSDLTPCTEPAVALEGATAGCSPTSPPVRRRLFSREYPQRGLEHNKGQMVIGHALHSSDLEEEWLANSEEYSVQVPGQRPKESGSAGRAKKPAYCTYFLEGHCKRTDCKYSHETGLITCRFWEQGACFKGVTCSFLHAYPLSHQHGGAEGVILEKEPLEEEEEEDIFANDGIMFEASPLKPIKNQKEENNSPEMSPLNRTFKERRYRRRDHDEDDGSSDVRRSLPINIPANRKGL